MKKWMKIAAPVLAASLVFSLAGCKTKSGLKTEGKLTMATNAEFQPFEYMQGGKVVGIDVDIATQIAKDMNATLSIDNMEFDSVIASIVSGKDDVGLAGISKTPTRAKSVDFSEPYYDASQVIVALKSNTAVTGKDSLKGKKLAVQQGTTGDDLAKSITGDANVERFTSYSDAISEVKDGKAAAVIIDSFPGAIFVKQNSDLQIVGQPMQSESYCIAVKKGNEVLLKQINATIDKMKKDGSLEAIVKKYS